jgi:hypothetical protein
MKKLIYTLITLSCLHTASTAASLSVVKGEVYVNKDKSFVLASPGMEVVSGAKILIKEKSRVVISYVNCSEIINEPMLYIVKKHKKCVAGFKEVKSKNLPFVGVIAGGIAVAGIITSVALTSDAKEKPISAE